MIGNRWIYKMWEGTFPSGCRVQPIRMVLAIVAESNLAWLQLDVESALLNAKVPEEVCVKMPPGYECKDMERGRARDGPEKKSVRT